MKRHGFLFALTAAALAVSMCGCGNVDGVVPSDNSSETADQTSSLVSGITESSAELSGVSSAAPETDGGAENGGFPSKLKIYNQTSVEFTDEQLFDFFNAHPECGTPQKSEYYSDEYHRYEADGCYGYINDGDNFFFSTDTGGCYYSAQYYLTAIDDDNPDKKYLTDGDLDFATREQALANVQKELSERFGIMPDEWYAFVFDAVTKDGVEAYKQQVYNDAFPENPDKDHDYEKEKARYERVKDVSADSFYYIDIKYKTDDIPLLMGGGLDYGDQRSVISTISYLVYGRNGIEEIVISPAYEPDPNADSVQAVDLIPADEARGFIQKKYDGLIAETTPEVREMRLFYLPIPQNDLGDYGKKYEMRPHYAFLLEETKTFEDETTKQNVTYTEQSVAYFDAVTGNELGIAYFSGSASEWGFDKKFDTKKSGG